MPDTAGLLSPETARAVFSSARATTNLANRSIRQIGENDPMRSIVEVMRPALTALGRYGKIPPAVFPTVVGDVVHCLKTIPHAIDITIEHIKGTSRLSKINEVDLRFVTLSATDDKAGLICACCYIKLSRTRAVVYGCDAQFVLMGHVLARYMQRRTYCFPAQVAVYS